MRNNKNIPDLESMLFEINRENQDLYALEKLKDIEEYKVFEEQIKDNIEKAMRELLSLDMSDFMIDETKKVFLNNLLIRIDVLKKVLEIPLIATRKIEINNDLFVKTKEDILQKQKK